METLKRTRSLAGPAIAYASVKQRVSTYLRYFRCDLFASKSEAEAPESVSGSAGGQALSPPPD